MAAEAEGITLLSMYDDDEEDEEAIVAPSEGNGNGDGEEANEISRVDNVSSDRLTLPIRDNTPQIVTSSPIRAKDGADSKTPRSSAPQPSLSWQQRVSGPQPSSPVSLVTHTPPSPVPLLSLQEPAVGRRVLRGALTIVDYAHDEAAMSPETEEKEKEGIGYILIRTELQGSDDVTTVAGV